MENKNCLDIVAVMVIISWYIPAFESSKLAKEVETI